jgi:hypothetical protein
MRTVTLAAAALIAVACSSNPVADAAAVCEDLLGSQFTADVATDGRSVTVSGGGRDDARASATVNTVGCLLSEAGAPQAVVPAIQRTRPIDGVQNYEWDGAQASWTFHPDAGINLTLEVR